jgi:prevent-host-death family protein
MIVLIYHIIMGKVADMLKTISALKARKNLGELLEEVYYRGDQYIIERAGKPMAAVVPLTQLQAWQERRDAFFDMVDEARAKNRKAKPATIEKEVTEAVRSTRTRRR